jgi:hypothetical protein
MVCLDRVPYGIWDPRLVVPYLVEDGKLDQESCDTRYDGYHKHDSLDEGASDAVWGVRSFISGDTPLITLFQQPGALRHGALIVLDGERFTGAVTRADIMSPVAQACLLVLTLQLEARALELCRLFAEECAAALGPERREKAMETLAHRLKPHFRGSSSDPDEKLYKLLTMSKPLLSRVGGKANELLSLLIVDATTLVDKFTMIRKCKLTIDLSHSRLKRISNRIERLRNACAHPGFEDFRDDLSFDDLVELAQDALALIGDFDEAAKRELRARGLLKSPSTNA